MIVVIAGAHASGKTTLVEPLQKAVPQARVDDFDAIGVPANADTAWRQQATEQWLQRYLSEKETTPLFILCGQVVLGELLACPSAHALDGLIYLLLDLDDKERICRLHKRGLNEQVEDVLGWAAWLREHTCHPQYKQQVIKTGAWSELAFDVWDTAANWPNWVKAAILNVTGMNLAEVVIAIKASINKNVQ